MAYYCTCNSQCPCNENAFWCHTNSHQCRCDSHNNYIAKGTREQTPFTYKTATISSLQGETTDSSWRKIHTAINKELEVRWKEQVSSWYSNPYGEYVYPHVANQVRQAIINATGGDVGTVYQYNNVYAYWFNSVIDRIHELQRVEVCNCDFYCACHRDYCGSHCRCYDECYCNGECSCECDYEHH